MRIRSLWSLALLGFMTGSGSAQTAAPAPEFEVASVRPSEPLDQGKVMAMVQQGKMPRFGPYVEGLSAEYIRMPLKQLIANAYEVKDYQVALPNSVSNQPFDIVAKMPEGSHESDAPKMLRTLLEQRFKMEAKKATDDRPVYTLVVGKGTLKMKESATKPAALDPKAELKPGETRMDGPFGPMIVKLNGDGSEQVNLGERGSYVEQVNAQSQLIHFAATSVNMDGLAEMLSVLMTSIPGAGGRPVINKTDLKGYYDFAFDLSLAELIRAAQAANGGQAPAQASDPGGGLSLEDSIQRLGLKLEPGKAPIEQVSVTHLEKMPTEN